MRKHYKHLTLLFVPIFLSGCATTMMGNSKNDKHQTEMALHKARTDVEEMRCELNTTQSQLQILANKLSNQELMLSTLKQDTVNQQQTRLDELAAALTQLEKSSKQLLKRHEEALADLQGLATQASDTQTALSQYKEKISEVEHKLATQTQQIEDIARMKQTVDELAQLSTSPSSETTGG